MKPHAKKRLIQTIVIFAFFALLSVYFATETLFVFLNRGIATSFWEQLGPRLIQWMPWALLALFVLGFAKRHPVDLKKWYSCLPTHLAAALFFSAIHSVLYIVVFICFQPLSGNLIKAFISVFLKSVHFDILVYMIIISLWNLWDYYRKNQQNELRTSQLEAKLAQAELDVLRMQLNPHFLFNTLHMITAHIRKSPDVAEKMIDRLSDLLRKTLEMTDSATIPLKEELEYLRIYLEIQECRFQERLKIELSIAPVTLDFQVPSLILQPLIENAVQYAIAPHAKAGTISLTSQKKDNHLILEIKDTGPGFPEEIESLFEKGRGLSNTKERLKLHYGNTALFSLDNLKGEGASVMLELPISERTE